MPDAFRRILAEAAPDALQRQMRKAYGLNRDITVLEALCRRLTLDALSGDISAAEFIAERTEGKVTLPVAVNEHDEPFCVYIPVAPVSEK